MYAKDNQILYSAKFSQGFKKWLPPNERGKLLEFPVGGAGLSN